MYLTCLSGQAHNAGIMNRLTAEKRAQVISALVEGNSLRSVVRMTGAAMNTVLKLLAELGQACSDYQRKAMRNLPCKHIQCDEIWQFCYAKDRNVPVHKRGKFGFGDVWTWVALCADTKLVPCWRIGRRNAWHAQHFMYDLASRLANRVQLTTDGHRVYLNAVEQAFGTDVDYAMLVKIYGNDPRGEETRYSPAECIGCQATPIIGRPKAEHISTSFVERQNLTMRMGMRRFTRLTNAFSKKIENLEHAVAIHYMHYNFARIHKTLRVTPAMEAGITDHVWSLEEIVNLLEPTGSKAA
jgi:IS1 family transposase